MMRAFEDANFIDCRINAYPAFLNEAEEKDYENGINLDIFAPNILFIDLDQKDFSSKSELNKALNKILKHISEALHVLNTSFIVVRERLPYHNPS